MQNGNENTKELRQKCHKYLKERKLMLACCQEVYINPTRKGCTYTYMYMILKGSQQCDYLLNSIAKWVKAHKDMELKMMQESLALAECL